MTPRSEIARRFPIVPVVVSSAMIFVTTATYGQEALDAAAQHVPPDPPQQIMGDMSYKDMVSMMQMDDTHRFTKVMLDQLEWRDAQEGGAGAWDAEGWYGGDTNKLWVKTQGERINGLTRDASVDVLADHVIARWWNAQGGVRQDFGKGPARTWLALGLQGVAPYWLDTEVTFYIGAEGRPAARLKATYDLLLTQRLIVQPYGELNIYGKADAQRQIGSGLSNLELSLRLRYEIRRELAPYLGVGWFRRLGATAERVRAAGGDSDAVELVGGLRIWF